MRAFLLLFLAPWFGIAQPPPPPSDQVSAIPQTASVTLAWDPSPDAASVTSYKVHSGVSSGVYERVDKAGTNTIYTVTNLVIGAEYFFAATAVGTNGLESEFSNEISYIVEEPPMPPSNIGVSQVVELTVVIEGSEDLTNWSALANFTVVIDSDKPVGNFRSAVTNRIKPAIEW